MNARRIFEAQLFEIDDEFGHEFPAARGRAVREARLGVRPSHLLRVEIRRVGREFHHPHARMPREEIPDDLSAGESSPGPRARRRDRARIRTNEQTSGGRIFFGGDVVAKAQAICVRTDREAADDREAISPESMANDRPFAARRPCAPQVRNELKSGLIDEGQQRVTGLDVCSAGVAIFARATPRSPARLARSRVVRASAASSHVAGASDGDGRGDSARRTDARSMRRSAARSTVRSRIRAAWLPCEARAGARATARGPVSLAAPATADVGVGFAPSHHRTRRASNHLGDVGQRHPLRHQRECQSATTSKNFGRSRRTHPSPSRYPPHRPNLARSNRHPCRVCALTWSRGE